MGAALGRWKERREGQKNSLELVRGKAEGGRRSQYLMGRRLLGSSSSKRVRSKAAEWLEVKSDGARLTRVTAPPCHSRVTV